MVTTENDTGDSERHFSECCEAAITEPQSNRSPSFSNTSTTSPTI